MVFVSALNEDGTSDRKSKCSFVSVAGTKKMPKNRVTSLLTAIRYEPNIADSILRRMVHDELPFLTNSRFTGGFKTGTRSMQGFGIYIFPNGSEYRGYFRNGLFHGYGHLRLAPPCTFTFKGFFENGELAHFEEMYFGDGLPFHAEITDNKVDATMWSYCTPHDRRFAEEIWTGLRPVSANALATNERPARFIPERSFDAEEGIYKSSTGFVCNVPPPFLPNRFVASRRESRWIEKHCRQGPLEGTRRIPQLPSPEFCNLIVNTNLRSLKKMEDVHTCYCNELRGAGFVLRKPGSHFHDENLNLPAELPSEKEDDSHSSGEAVLTDDSCTDCASFSDESLLFKELIENCQTQIDTLRRQRRNESESSSGSDNAFSFDIFPLI